MRVITCILGLRLCAIKPATETFLLFAVAIAKSMKYCGVSLPLI